jgi:putative colanic acid biosynthesis glycosyltransferase
MNSLANDPALFSIVTVVFNDIGGLKKTLASVQSQSFRDFQQIVVDGKSDDGTAEYLQLLEYPNLEWMSESDLGIYDAMNKGIHLSTGNYVVFLNAGDLFPSTETLARIAKALSVSALTGPDIVFGGASLVLAKGMRFYRAPRKMEDYVWHGLPANHQATYFRRTMLKTTLYDLRYRICGDYFLVAELYKQRPSTLYINEPLVDFRVGDTSYQNPLKLFLEPYRIQRDILCLPLHTRIRSLMKRLVSTLGLVVLCQPWGLGSSRKSQASAS